MIRAVIAAAALAACSPVAEITVIPMSEPAHAGYRERITYQPVYTPRLFACTWREGQTPECAWGYPDREYPSMAACYAGEWSVIVSVNARAKEAGLLLAVRVNCSREYDA